MQGLIIKRFLTELNETNMYLVIDKDTYHAILIDPSDEAVIKRYVLEENFCLEIDYIILTHEHYDHISALEEVRKLFSSCKVIASKLCSKRIQQPKENLSKYFNSILAFKGSRDAVKNREYHIEPFFAKAADMVFELSMYINWKGHYITLIEAPGHSPGSILISIDEKYLFCGDSLSCDYEVVTGFPGGNRKSYEQITKPLFDFFDRKIMVYPGHGKFEFLEKMLDLIAQQ